MGCPPVRGDNPRALASGLSYVQVDKHGITFYTTYISVDLAHQVIFHAKVGKGGKTVLFVLVERTIIIIIYPFYLMQNITKFSWIKYSN